MTMNQVNQTGGLSMTDATVTAKDVNNISRNLHHDPFEILGPHQVADGEKKVWVVRAWLPDAKEVFLRQARGKKEYPLQSVFHPQFFEIKMPQWQQLPMYTFRIVGHNGHERVIHDPYFFLPQIGELDMHLFSAGDHHKIYEKLGAHLKVIN